MAKKFIVDLNEAEKEELIKLTQKGRPGARKIKRANILLLANAGKTDFEIAELLNSSWSTVLRTGTNLSNGSDFEYLRNGNRFNPKASTCWYIQVKSK